MPNSTPTLGLRATLRILAARPAGAHSSDPLLSAWTTKQIASQATRLVVVGQLFPGKVSHREVRYFADINGRDAFVLSHTAPRRRKVGLVWKVSGRAPWADTDEPIITSQTKITMCPSHAPRNSEQRFAFVHG